MTIIDFFRGMTYLLLALVLSFVIGMLGAAAMIDDGFIVKINETRYVIKTGGNAK